MAEPLTVFIVAGEESGDQLGAKLVRALKARFGAERLRLGGVGRAALGPGGDPSQFTQHHHAVMWF